MSESASPEPASPDPAERPDPSLPGGIPLFLLALVLLALIRIGIGYVSLPLGWLPITNLILAVLFLGVPILALFFAANSQWTWKAAAAFVVGGIALQAAIILGVNPLTVPPQLVGVLGAVAQVALACWCAGLGALLATRIKDKNIILPIAIFLAAYDFFLVLTPWGFTQKLMKVVQPAFSKVAGQIPVVSAHPTHGIAQAGAYIGMADFVFLAMFFIALFRFRMRTRQTLYAVLPALVLYLIVVLVFGRLQIGGFALGQLPALVPIGLAVLIVNWREFDLKRDEKIATTVLAVLVIAFLAYATTRPKPQPELEQSAPAPTPQKSAG